jgi:hypothetical protein
MFAHSLDPQVLPRMSPGLSEQSWATSRLLAEKLSLWTLGKVSGSGPGDCVSCIEDVLGGRRSERAQLHTPAAESRC